MVHFHFGRGVGGVVVAGSCCEERGGWRMAVVGRVVLSGELEAVVLLCLIQDCAVALLGGSELAHGE